MQSLLVYQRRYIVGIFIAICDFRERYILRFDDLSGKVVRWRRFQELTAFANCISPPALVFSV